jgi:hypothetical protein
MSQSKDEEEKQLHLLFDALTTNSRWHQKHPHLSKDKQDTSKLGNHNTHMKYNTTQNPRRQNNDTAVAITTR